MLLIDALKTAGYGNWHVMYYTVTIPLLAICCAHIYLNITIAYSPLHRCRTPPGAKWTDFIRKIDVTADNKSMYASCDMYKFHAVNGSYKISKTLQSCSDHFEYMEDTSDFALTEDAKPISRRFGPTLSQKLNVTCNHVFSSAFPGLSSVAIWPFQPLSLPFMDKLGRKSVLCVTLSLSGIILAITPYVATYWNMWVIRCLQRIFIQIAYLALTRHIVELHPIDERHCTIALTVTGYAAGLPFLILLDWLFSSNWRKVVYALAMSTLIWTPVVILFFPESPLFWVVNVNREKEADSVVGRIARWNAVARISDQIVDEDNSRNLIR
ncbi:hypothetical protein RvY_12158-3 [Ramazzottius varieornatus]|uniref:Major facilitator superfamily (MFS) profile domain-containing protein n=1 Tax=Ramazzottius varieornatus TaxID=947166 RepID=A0A1D1VNZ1_RAMVA|nr:hypothetical protein RvY_12158-3 [Ramazzottius varieornatus]